MTAREDVSCFGGFGVGKGVEKDSGLDFTFL